MDTAETPAGSIAPSEEISDTERAIYKAVTPSELYAFLDAWAEQRLGSPIADVRFRAGRIDAVWGVELQDGRAVVIKTHRPPVDLDATCAAVDAERTLAATGFPCPHPLAGPEEIDGHVLTAETLIVGTTPDGRDPTMRRLLAEGLSRHIEILRDHPDLVQRAGPGPSWCHYQGGPWPVPHDTLVDLGSTLDGFEWIDAFGQRAADQILANRDAEVVVGHADWYAGNTAVIDGVLVGTFDWELVADTEAVIAGFAAACFAASATGGGGLSTPEEAAAFMRDYEKARMKPFTEREQRAAAGAVAWIMAFNARWQAALIEHNICDFGTIALVRDHQEEYLSLPVTRDSGGSAVERGWTWDPTLYAGSAAHYAVGRVPYPPQLATALVEALELAGTERLLDVGCGPGSLTLLLAPYVAEAIGVDADPDMIMEAERLADQQHLTNTTWRHLRAEDLPADVLPVDVVTFAQSFHWMDRRRVAAAARDLLNPGAALVHVHATTHQGIEDISGASGEPVLPRPPWEAITDLVRRYLGPQARAGRSVLPAGIGGGDEAEIYRDAGFIGPRRLSVPGSRVERTDEQIMASVHSLSSATPHLFGDRLEAFDIDLRQLLATASRHRRFAEQMPAIDVDIWRTPG